MLVKDRRSLRLSDERRSSANAASQNIADREALRPPARAAEQWAPARAGRTEGQGQTGVRRVQLPVMRRLRAPSKPVLTTKAGHASEVLGVVRHENDLLRDRVCRDHRIETADRCPLGREGRSKATKVGGGFGVEG